MTILLGMRFGGPLVPLIVCVDVVLVVFLVVRLFRYVREYERCFERTYPELTARLKKENAWRFRLAWPGALLYLTFGNDAVRKDEELAALKRRMMRLYVCIFALAIPLPLIVRLLH